MAVSGKMLKSVFVALVLVALVESGPAGEKLATCCTAVNKQEITEPITGYMVQRSNPPCVLAVIFQTETGLYCSLLTAPWVRRKIIAFERAKTKATTSPVTPSSTASLLSIIKTTTPFPMSSSLPPTSSSLPPTSSSLPPTSSSLPPTSSSLPPSSSSLPPSSSSLPPSSSSLSPTSSIPSSSSPSSSSSFSLPPSSSPSFPSSASSSLPPSSSPSSSSSSIPASPSSSISSSSSSLHSLTPTSELPADETFSEEEDE